MANEVINSSQRYFLVQTNNETKVERALYQDNYNGMFQPTTTLYNAKSYNTEEEAQKVADGINFLYQITGQPFTAEVVDESIQRRRTKEPTQDTLQEDTQTNENVEPTTDKIV